MKSSDEVGITFANLVAGQGIHNGVVNVALAAFQFTPNTEDQKIEPDPVITARLRLDISCARALHSALGKLLEKIDTPAAAVGVAPIDEEPRKAETIN